jgi:hypothetical protein
LNDGVFRSFIEIRCLRVVQATFSTRHFKLGARNAGVYVLKSPLCLIRAAANETTAAPIRADCGAGVAYAGAGMS